MELRKERLSDGASPHDFDRPQPVQSSGLQTLYETHPIYRAFENDTRSAGSFEIALVHARQSAFEATDPQSADWCFVAGRRWVEGAAAVEIDLGDGWIRNRIETRSSAALNVVPAGVEASFRTGHDHTIKAFSVPDVVLRELLDEHGLSASIFEPWFGTIRQAPQATDLIDRMWTCSTFLGASGTLMLDALVLQFVASCAMTGNAHAEASKPSRTDDVRIDRVIDYVEAYLTEALTVRELAGIACVSPFHFSRIFRTAMGRTPHDYVMGRRTRRAQHLLRESEDTPAQIAFLCGFASQSHMTDVFRARIGVPPARYRAEVRN